MRRLAVANYHIQEVDLVKVHLVPPLPDYPKDKQDGEALQNSGNRLLFNASTIFTVGDGMKTQF